HGAELERAGRSAIMEACDRECLLAAGAQVAPHQGGAAFAVVRIEHPTAIARYRGAILVRLAESELLRTSDGIGKWHLPEAVIRAAQVSRDDEPFPVRGPAEVVNARRELPDLLGLAAFRRDFPQVGLRPVVAPLLAGDVAMGGKGDPTAVSGQGRTASG